MTRTGHKLALLAGAALLLSATAAQAQDTGTPPAGGVVNLDAGFTPDPKIVSVMAGGRHNVSENIGGSCTGFVSRAPDLQVNYNTASTLPLIFSVTADGDTTLVINGPDRRWHCNDDTNGFDPQVMFDQPGTGRYLIWIGTFGGRDNIPARLSISEIAPVVEEPVVEYNPVIDPTLPATYENIALRSGFTPDPRTVRVTAGGTIDGSTIASSCVGTFAGAPDVQLDYSAGSLPLIISADSARDTTLMINDPQGNWWCDDDGGLNASNPSIRFDKPGSGTYDIWVGTYGSDTADATLYISELSSQ